MALRSIENIDPTGKMVLVCADFDVPATGGAIRNHIRVRTALPTLNFLSEKRAKIVIVSFLDRPQGWDSALSLRPIAEELARLMNRKLIVLDNAKSLPEYDIPHLYFFPQDFTKTDILPLLSAMRPQDIALLENIRFYRGEHDGDLQFTKQLASFGEIYVNECFAGSHRSAASIVGVPKILPSFAGIDFMKDVKVLDQVRRHPRRPVIMMIGGMKVPDKLAALLRLGKLADMILAGGGLASALLSIQDFQIGKSLISLHLSHRDEKNLELLAKEFWRDYRDKIRLPVDYVVASSAEGPAECVKPHAIKASQMILDIGPETIRLFAGYLKGGQTLIWNGPLGFIEKHAFAHGTQALAKVFAAKTKRSVFGIAGGGETSQVLANEGLINFVDHVSSGGAAMLEMLATGTLPGIKALEHGEI